MKRIIISKKHDENHVSKCLKSCSKAYKKRNFINVLNQIQMIDIDLLLSYGAAYKKTGTNEVLFHEGEECHFYYQLIEGTVRWVNINDEGKEYVHDLIVAGESIGEMPLFDDEPYAATAITNKECLLIRLQKQHFIQLLKEDPKIHFLFSKLLAQRLRFKFLMSKELANHKPEEKICTLLNYYKSNKKFFCPKCNMVQLTRQQIADITGLRVETVIRSIRQLHENGKLAIAKGKVYY
ncbi:Crp/Fnr family transcriptional regulator [Hydrotalea sandarakina]|jgi:CRP-like cAMP-binding protein|uniref:CRP-like cAMP-binding protein n=1 Tax=Hydrotalea sandarakina TaxID=1004304 RepID=A0A2W7SFA2_9BACT|nr:Crp/Fnr family transcriptional regulator [Hydrotalea sandarakina]PZX61535.1 CRP-like cAMP-binding protein [Hydrotalea sandarakina]